MTHINSKISQELFLESKSLKQIHMFNNGKTTFRQIRNVLNDVFSTNTLAFSKTVPFVQLYITSKDGKFFTSTVKNVGKLIPIEKMSTLSEKESNESINETAKDIVEALSVIDPVLINRYFANGKNCMKCSLICPPKTDNAYQKKCFIKFDGIDCFDNKCKLIGQDQKAAFELYKILKSAPQLNDEFQEISIDQLRSLKNYCSEKTILPLLMDKLNSMVDGLGWGCTIDYYIHDKACRSIINKALEHNLDISKNGQLINELISRICGTSLRPTKSDLITFAKREGIDCKSDNYKNFLHSIEDDQQNIANEIIKPIDNMLYFAISKIANNIICLMNIDSNPQTKKILNKIAIELFTIADTIDNCEFECSKLDTIKHNISKLIDYIESAPVEIRIMHGGTPYAIKQSIQNIKKLYDIVM